MKKKEIKFLYRIILSLLLVLTVCAAGCNGKLMSEAPFNINTEAENFNPPKITFIRTAEEFNSFLGDKEIFATDFSRDFIEINEQYDGDFFKNNDLIALILRGTSSMILGYRLNKIYDRGGVLVLNISSVAEKANITADMGRYFCYYVSVNKDANINTAEIEFN